MTSRNAIRKAAATPVDTIAVPPAAPPPIEIIGDRLSVHFRDFGSDVYQLFLKVKSLPEYDVQFVPETESYRITAPARFAAMLGADRSTARGSGPPLADYLFDDQRAIVRMALESKRFAIWAGCGNGKTPMGLEVARHAHQRTAGRVLIFTINEIVQQWIDEAKHFYGDELPLYRLKSRDEMKAFCAGTLPAAGPFAIANYEKLNYRDKSDQVVNEMRNLAGVIVDENRLKTGGGKQKWSLVKSTKGIEYKLSLTATPAPNDTMEFASQASFLEKMRSDREIIWTFFQRNEKTHRWDVKPHARKAFFEFMSGWSIYVNDPRRYGWRKDFPDVPLPVVTRHDIHMTDDQRSWLARLSRSPCGQLSLIDRDDRNTIQRAKLSQVAKGFVYQKTTGGAKRIVPIESEKPAAVAEIIAADVRRGLQVLVWTVFDAESVLIGEALERIGIEYDGLHGSTKRVDRQPILERFRTGTSQVLVTKGKLLGFGMNFQCCGSMVFSGFNDSYEEYYQQWRRAVRFGQDKRVRIHLPVIEELEGDMLENLYVKQAKHEAAIAEMEANYIAAMQRMKLAG